MSFEELRSANEPIAGDVGHPRLPKLTSAEARMVSLGVTPAMIDEDTAAAVCGLPRCRFCALCPIPGQKIGRKTLRPLDLVKKWSVECWAEATGHSLGDTTSDANSTDDEDWANLLPSAGPLKNEGGRDGIAH